MKQFESDKKQTYGNGHDKLTGSQQPKAICPSCSGETGVPGVDCDKCFNKKNVPKTSDTHFRKMGYN